MVSIGRIANNYKSRNNSRLLKKLLDFIFLSIFMMTHCTGIGIFVIKIL